jgi:hypothetical protein
MAENKKATQEKFRKIRETIKLKKSAKSRERMAEVRRRLNKGRSK